eukprot:15819_1
MDSFQNMLPAEILAVRNGHHVARPASSLVPGDLLELKSGDKIPADVRVIRCSKGCSADHSSLTGESDAQQRSPEADVGEPEPMEAKSLLFFGTLLVRGHCTGVVIATGDHTLMGRIARLADETEMHETPIAIELDNFVKKISILAVVIALIFGSLSFMKASGSTSFVSNFAKAVVFFIGILVANVPEGLLATVTVSLTLTAKRMSKKAVLVKNMEAVEALGSTNVICSDKTGTLTMNVMTVAHVFYDMDAFEVDTSDPMQGEFDDLSPCFQKLVRCAVLCNNAKFTKSGNIDGDASETALLKMCAVHVDHDTKASLSYTLSSNVPELLPFLLFVMLGIPIPLETIHILLIDMGTDLLPAISYAYEVKESNIMRRAPRDPKKDHLVTWKLINFAYLQIGILQFMAGMYTYLVVLRSKGLMYYDLVGLSGASEFQRCEGFGGKYNYLNCYNDGRPCAYSTTMAPKNEWREEHGYKFTPLSCADRQALLTACHSAYLVAIVIVQLADLIICKTRYKSLFTHGMGNKFMNYSMLFAVGICLVFLYLPCNVVVQTSPIPFWFWCPALPFAMFIVVYDETKKFFVRKYPTGWLDRYATW